MLGGSHDNGQNCPGLSAAPAAPAQSPAQFAESASPGLLDKRTLKAALGSALERQVVPIGLTDNKGVGHRDFSLPLIDGLSVRGILRAQPPA